MDPQSPNPQDTPPTPRMHWGWWLILLALMAWNIYAFLPHSAPEVSLPYSTFLEQVKSGNVASVKITGSAITGSFINAYTPPATDTGTAQATPASTQSSAAAGASSASQPVSYTNFQTTFPEVVGDNTLMGLLNQHQVEVNVSPPPSPWFAILLTDGLPLLLLVGVMIWMGRQATRNQSGIFKIGQSQARRMTGENPVVTFEDVAGVDEAKAELKRWLTSCAAHKNITISEPGFPAASFSWATLAQGRLY